MSSLLARVFPVFVILATGYMLASVCERLATRLLWMIRARDLREREGTAPAVEGGIGSMAATYGPRAVFWLVIAIIFVVAANALR